MASVTASALLDSQAALLEEAAEALPHSFSQCTYHLGYIRQAVYLCHTCGEKRGICSACSIACHTDHEQLELFPKRKFRCDCPTRVLAHACALHTPVEEENTQNHYSHNFSGNFCRCGRAYDAKVERETMIQCLSCEDWFHESCLNLREQPVSREPTPTAQVKPEEPAEDDDARSEASSSGLPPPLIGASAYEALVCASCVQKIDTLKRYAGTPGVLMVARDDAESAWKVVDSVTEAIKNEREHLDVDFGPPIKTEPTDADIKIEQNGDAAVGNKRPHPDDTADTPDAKRHRLGDDTLAGSSPLDNNNKICLSPPTNPLAQRILNGATSLGAGDVFLTDGFRDRWCKCSDCLPSLQANSFLLEEEETYEPPDDPDVGISLEELGLRALQRIPRDRAIDGIHAFNELRYVALLDLMSYTRWLNTTLFFFRDQLMAHLRPFAEQGQVVTESDIKQFFESKIQNGQ
ncbi:hypothetical protein EIP86_009288 [Pleurotus ostreatoroseus]|nr:hypothetical protein EIP86_009288 [Pleurotus ostreatoroseus]